MLEPLKLLSDVYDFPRIDRQILSRSPRRALFSLMMTWISATVVSSLRLLRCWGVSMATPITFGMNLSCIPILKSKSTDLIYFMLFYSFRLVSMLVSVNGARTRDLAYKRRDTVEDIFQQNWAVGYFLHISVLWLQPKPTRENKSENNICGCQISHCILGGDVGFDWIPSLLQFLLRLHELYPP